jgi:hypothetical protein
MNSTPPEPDGSDSGPATAIEVSPAELIHTARRGNGSSPPPPVGDGNDTPLTTPSGLLKTEAREEPTVVAARGSNLRLAFIVIVVLTAAAAIASFLAIGR